jgi:hypothetical protein
LILIDFLVIILPARGRDAVFLMSSQSYCIILVSWRNAYFQHADVSLELLLTFGYGLITKPRMYYTENFMHVASTSYG